MTDNPDDSKMRVLRSGICRGLKGWTPLGGQFMPSSIVGESLLWKNPQKKEMKKKTSEIINKIIPHRIPIVTT